MNGVNLWSKGGPKIGCMNPGTCVVAEYGRSVPPDLTQDGYRPLEPIGSPVLGKTAGTSGIGREMTSAGPPDTGIVATGIVIGE